jgi:hypothetical protein
LPFRRRQVQSNSMFLDGFPFQEHGGTTCFLAAWFAQGRAAWQVAASTIRCPLALFNLELVETDSS